MVNLLVTCHVIINMTSHFVKIHCGGRIQKTFSPTALALGSLAIVKVSGRPPPLAFLGANSVGLEKGSVEGSPNICLPVLSVLLGPWGKFRWPRKRFSGFCGRFPQLFFTFVSQRSLVMWEAPLTLLYFCLPIFSSKKLLWKVLPTFVSQSCLFFWGLGANSAGLEKGSPGSVEGSPNFSLHLSPSVLWLCGRLP